MARYRYKEYLYKAFWNSLLATLSAFVLVLIIFYGWQVVQKVISQVISINDTKTDEVDTEDRMGLLESLKSGDVPSEVERQEFLEQLSSDEEISEEEKLNLLNELSSPQDE